MGIIKLLLDSAREGSPIGQDRNDGWAVYCAARNGHEEVLSFLLNEGAEPNFVDLPHTPLSRAAEGGHLGVINILLDSERGGRPFCPMITDYDLAASCAARNGHEIVLSVLLETMYNHTDTYASLLDAYWYGFYKAAKKGHLTIVKLLAGSRNTAKCVLCNDYPTLGLAAAKGHRDVVAFLLQRRAEFVKCIRHNSSDIRTPLSLATRGGHLNIVKMLLEAGALVNWQDHRGRIALGLAAEKWPSRCR